MGFKKIATCEICHKTFFNTNTKNRHMKLVHQVIQDTRKKHIICPLCKEENVQGTFENLKDHLLESHQVSIDVINLTFSSQELYENWAENEKIGVNYALCRRNRTNEASEVYYVCNRSNFRDYKSNCHIRAEKSGGTIKIHGVCPSHLLLKIYKNGEYGVRYYKTHAGHEAAIRTQQLSQEEKKTESQEEINEAETRQILLQQVIGVFNRMDFKTFSKFANQVLKYDEESKVKPTGKRKMETQEYSPKKQKKY